MNSRPETELVSGGIDAAGCYCIIRIREKIERTSSSYHCAACFTVLAADLSSTLED
jgi:hypothetical protein